MIDTRTDCPMVSRPSRVVDQNADRQVAGLRVGHPADEGDLPGHLLFFLGRGVRRRVAGIAVPDACGHPDVHRRCRPGRQPDRREDLPGIDDLADRVPIAIVWPGWQCRLSSTPSIGARMVW